MAGTSPAMTGEIWPVANYTGEPWPRRGHDGAQGGRGLAVAGAAEVGGLEAMHRRGPFPAMARDDRHIIDMTLEGEFVAPPPPPKPPIGARILLWAIVAMVLAVTALIV